MEPKFFGIDDAKISADAFNSFPVSGIGCSQVFATFETITNCLDHDGGLPKAKNTAYFGVESSSYLYVVELIRRLPSPTQLI